MILTITFPLQCLCALALSFLYHPIEISADICLSPSTPKNGDTSSTLLDKPAKQCPDFKDPEDQIACCPSQISNGEFFCCTRGKKSELEAALAAEARKKFISSHIPELIICFLAILALSFLICTCLCRNSSFCPLLHRRRKAHQEDRHGSASLSLQSNNSICRSSIGRFHNPRHQLPRTPHQQFVRQQQTDLPLFHKEYDAPPPYSFTPCPPPPLAIAPLNCLMNEEEQQNRLNAQREELDETEQK